MDQHPLHGGDILNQLLNICGHHRGGSVEVVHALKFSVMARYIVLTIHNTKSFAEILFGGTHGSSLGITFPAMLRKESFSQSKLKIPL